MVTHAELVERAVRWLRGTMGCGVVLCERDAGVGEIPDAIGWRLRDVASHLVECKVTRADFFADLKKQHRANHLGGLGGVTAPFSVMPQADTILVPKTLRACSTNGPGIGAPAHKNVRKVGTD